MTELRIHSPSDENLYPMRVEKIRVKTGDTIQQGMGIFELQDKTGKLLAIGPVSHGKILDCKLNVGDILLKQEELFVYVELPPEETPVEPSLKNIYDKNSVNRMVTVTSPPMPDSYPMRIKNYTAKPGDRITPDDRVVLVEDKSGRLFSITAPTVGKILVPALAAGDILLKPEVLFKYEEGDFPDAPRPIPQADKPNARQKPSPSRPKTTQARHPQKTASPPSQTQATKPAASKPRQPSRRHAVVLVLVCTISPFLITMFLLRDEMDIGGPDSLVEIAQEVSSSLFGGSSSSGTSAPVAREPSIKARVKEQRSDLAAFDRGNVPEPTVIARQDFSNWMERN